MPFTVSHVAAVLPFVARRHASRIVPAAWVIGSMVPDVPWFFTGGRGAAFLHSLAGLVTVDLALGLLLLALWRGVLFAPVRDLLPPQVGCRLPAPVPVWGTRWGWAALGVVLGATTHLVWDDFTHEGRWAVSRIGWLYTEHAGVLGSQWAQYASGVVGGVVVLAACGRILARSEPVPADGWVTPAQRWQALGAVGGAGLVGAAYGVLKTAGLGAEVVLFRVVTWGGALATGALLLVCIVWWLRRPPGSTGDRHARAVAAGR